MAAAVDWCECVTPAAWLRSVMRERWWSIPGVPQVALGLVAMADSTGGKPVVRSTSDRLALELRMSRASLRRALDVLEAAGFCVVESSRGRGGATAITISDRRPFDGASQLAVSVEQSESDATRSGHLESGSLAIIRPIDSEHRGHLENGSQVTEMVCESLADLGDRGHFICLELAISDQKSEPPRARDLDLLRSEVSDLRSSDSGDQTRSKRIKISNIDGPEPKRSRVDASKIPDRAWAAADYLRGCVLREDPAAVVGRRPWDESSKTGLRLTWANEFRLIHERDERPWDDIAKVVSWLFKQTGPAQFVVQSPDALRTKWDRIQAVRRNQQRADAQPKRGPDGRPDPQAAREFRRLDPNNPWGDQ